MNMISCLLLILNFVAFSLVHCIEILLKLYLELKRLARSDFTGTYWYNLDMGNELELKNIKDKTNNFVEDYP